MKEREMNLQNKYNKAKQSFENDSNDANLTLLCIAQEELETFYEKKVEGIIIRSEPGGMNMVREVLNIFLI